MWEEYLRKFQEPFEDMNLVVSRADTNQPMQKRGPIFNLGASSTGDDLEGLAKEVEDKFSIKRKDIKENRGYLYILPEEVVDSVLQEED